MRKLQGVKWNNTYKNNENINYFDGSIYGISEMILAMICTILFVVSSNIIFSDVFQWANFSGISFVLMIIIQCRQPSHSIRCLNQLLKMFFILSMFLDLAKVIRI